ncbi:MAG: type-F conjugative transfer system pilin assembly protein TrbC [Gammaproteobacteria bacterium]|nr:type-F conjugative transfer system pilin assembly protein TrbC [Gammaproteobacteria bacterium]
MAFHSEAAPTSATTFDDAAHMQPQVQRQTTKVFTQAETLATSSDFLRKLEKSAAAFSDKLNKAPTMSLPDLPDPDPEQLARARAAINQLLDQVGENKNLSAPHQGEESQLYIFVSFSMPELTLLRLLEQSQHLNAPLVLRGLVNNDMSQTRLKINQLLGADQQGHTTISGGFTIDPTLYERFGVVVVPTFVLTEGSVRPCNQTDCPTPTFVRLAGDITMEYALESMGKSRPSIRPITDTLLTELRRTH